MGQLSPRRQRPDRRTLKFAAPNAFPPAQAGATIEALEIHDGLFRVTWSTPMTYDGVGDGGGLRTWCASDGWSWPIGVNQVSPYVIDFEYNSPPDEISFWQILAQPNGLIQPVRFPVIGNTDNPELV